MNSLLKDQRLRMYNTDYLSYSFERYDNVAKLIVKPLVNT